MIRQRSHALHRPHLHRDRNCLGTRWPPVLEGAHRWRQDSYVRSRGRSLVPDASSKSEPGFADRVTDATGLSESPHTRSETVQPTFSGQLLHSRPEGLSEGRRDQDREVGRSPVLALSNCSSSYGRRRVTTELTDASSCLGRIDCVSCDLPGSRRARRHGCDTRD